jgi:ATP-dependent RNA helicase RhlE
MLQTPNTAGFDGLHLSPRTLATLSKLGYSTPTPIQAATIPSAVDGKDVIGLAQTGTGKTLAFALPIVERVQKGQCALVMAPTRELALQIEETLRKLNLRTALLVGGAPMGRQISQLKTNPTVVVATPGRLEDHLKQRNLTLKAVSIVVLDEADRMLDLGFAPAIRRILSQTPWPRQTLLFSATMPKDIASLADEYLQDPVRVEIARPGTAAANVTQELIVIPGEAKESTLQDLLYESKGPVLVFARTRHGARKLAKTVRNMGHSAAELHSDRTLNQRREAMTGFKSGAYRILVATDIAARGIDVKDIELVINYDVPDCAEDYVHRIGRTGRAGASGRAITLATPAQHKDIRDIERIMKTKMELSPKSTTNFPAGAPQAQPKPGANRGGGGGQGGARPNSRHGSPKGPGRTFSGPRPARPRVA